ncbi:hypothetical protein [Saprospira grandis]|uniref:hypothetical protein n=1 Tax=Saprospira grandis TaxID=1008 RepID=UPI0022DCE888|nr:hypothetical protein [Saprospira grandis]WBM75473.1 hypothetical protein OP864_04340 [Saprospira grandis]
MKNFLIPLLLFCSSILMAQTSSSMTEAVEYYLEIGAKAEDVKTVLSLFEKQYGLSYQLSVSPSFGQIYQSVDQEVFSSFSVYQNHQPEKILFSSYQDWPFVIELSIYSGTEREARFLALKKWLAQKEQLAILHENIVR